MALYWIIAAVGWSLTVESLELRAGSTWWSDGQVTLLTILLLLLATVLGAWITEAQRERDALRLGDYLLLGMMIRGTLQVASPLMYPDPVGETMLRGFGYMVAGLLGITLHLWLPEQKEKESEGA
jgi:hypothetical protein